MFKQLQKWSMYNMSAWSAAENEQCLRLTTTLYLFLNVCVGSRLLSADGDGQIKCWAMTEHLVNSWESTQSSSVEGDPIVALSWLHNGVKLALHVEKARRTS